MLRHTFSLEQEAALIENAVSEVLAAGHRTKDLAQPGQQALSTIEMGAKVAEAVNASVGDAVRN
jgi:3-isopropylmalate dehydrogenase